MFDKQDPKVLWVSPESVDGDGTFDSPFCEIEQALSRVQPGYTIVLKNGTYKGDLTIQVSGSASKPVRIVSDEDAKVIMENSCWFLYDVSDLIISGLFFVNSPGVAVSVIGACKRNRFESIHFINCGSAEKASCTMFFGGSGADCNVVENCTFEHTENYSRPATLKNASVGLMVSEGDLENCLPIRKHVFRRNRFVNYEYGILVGSSDATINEYGHIVEYNTIENCRLGGILVKCGDTQVRGNLVKGSVENSITVSAGTGTIIEDNRIIDCGTGVQVNGSGHSLVNNCIVRCGSQAIRVCGKSKEKAAAINLFIENNTCIECGSKDAAKVAGIVIEAGTTSIIHNNLIYGEGIPYRVDDSPGNTGNNSTPKAQYVVENNIASGKCEPIKGFNLQEVVFQGYTKDNFENDSGYGASGWMLKPETFDPHMDDFVEDKDYIESSILEDEDGELVIPGDVENYDLFSRFYTGQIDMETQSEED
jgi:hypothetical protein